MEYTTKDNIIKIFEEGITEKAKGERSIISLNNGKDCFIGKMPAEAYAKFKEAFGISAEETILMARDTSVWNNKKTGIVITDQRIVYRPTDKEDMSKEYHFLLKDIAKISFEQAALVIWHKGGSCYPIPIKAFFKYKMKSYDTEQAANQLAALLNNICQLFFEGGGNNNIQ